MDASRNIARVLIALKCIFCARGPLIRFGALMTCPLTPVLIDNASVAGLFYGTGLTQKMPQSVQPLRLSLLRGNHLERKWKTHYRDTVPL